MIRLATLPPSQGEQPGVVNHAGEGMQAGIARID
jgi:hypothetical protein